MGTYFITYEFTFNRLGISKTLTSNGYAVLDVEDIRDMNKLTAQLIEYQKNVSHDIHKPWYITKITLINKL